MEETLMIDIEILYDSYMQSLLPVRLSHPARED